MAKITISRHGDRWALSEDGGTPIAEYETRELAELAARNRDGDYEIDDTPREECLGGGAIGDETTGVRSSDAGIDQRTGGAGSGDQTTSEPQGGL